MFFFKDFNNLMYNKTKHKCKKHFCMHCLQCFSSEDVLTNHKTNCTVMLLLYGEEAIKMPGTDNNILKFQTFHKQMQVLFLITSAEREAKDSRHSGMYQS